MEPRVTQPGRNGRNLSLPRDTQVEQVQALPGKGRGTLEGSGRSQALGDLPGSCGIARRPFPSKARFRFAPEPKKQSPRSPCHAASTPWGFVFDHKTLKFGSKHLNLAQNT